MYCTPRGRLVGFALIAPLVALVVAVGCQKPPQAQQTPPPPVVTVIQPGSAEVQKYYQYNGYLEPVEVVEVRARVKGYLDKVLFKEGDEVTAGDKLYQIDPREYQTGVAKSEADIAQAEANISSAQARVDEAQKEWDRIKDLQGASGREKNTAKATLEVSEAQLKLAKANLLSAQAALRTANIQLGYTDIKAPISGLINNTEVTPGNLVGQTDTTLLTTIVRQDPLYVYFDAPERDLIEYQRAQAAAATAGSGEQTPVQVGVSTEEGFPHVGHIDFRENRVNSGTGTVRIRGQIPNPKVSPGDARVLYPGLFARVRVPLGPPSEQLVIPESALLTGQEGRFVYVLGPENVVTKRTVTVGATVWRSPPEQDETAPRWQLLPPDGKKMSDLKPAERPPALRSMVAIEGGLKPGDRVIVVGLQRARPGAPVTPEVWTLSAPKK